MGIRKAMAALMLGAGVVASPLVAQQATPASPPGSAFIREPVPEDEALEAIQRVQAFLQQQNAVEIKADVMTEEVYNSGQKIIFGHRLTYRMQRPDKVHLDFQSAVIARRIFFDGAQVTVSEPRFGFCAQADAKGGIKGLFTAAEGRGIGMPLANDDDKAHAEARGKAWEGKFEFEMFGAGEDAGKIAVRLRHAHGSWGPILGGQTNSLFLDGDIFPNGIDDWGPAGMVFLRTPQLRFTPYDRNGLRLSVAAEYALDDIDGGGIRLIDHDLASNLRGRNTIPDFTFQARYGQDWGHVQVAGILRKIGYETLETVDNEPKGSELGWGVNATGVYKAGIAAFRASRRGGRCVHDTNAAYPTRRNCGSPQEARSQRL